ncbi:hypothetical protein Pmani_006493 [Petrolisthes manimaculis]|uniref:DDE Tnp4 domain-containing protein n=1 Tax=Petrolisthes manimaculis TaxID=1843537 RepID=A0AAE1UGC9_9EUCA|nr:hypothetical protein Pmani_006493 [Petrolisthes manimaculis]
MEEAPALRVAITLRFPATGNSYKSLGYAFRVAPNTISLIVPETCIAIIEAFVDEYLQIPDSVEGWKQIANGINERWYIPHTLGAIDGKHIRVWKLAPLQLQESLLLGPVGSCRFRLLVHLRRRGGRRL